MVSKSGRPRHKGQSSWGASPCKCHVQMCPTCRVCFCHGASSPPVRLKASGKRPDCLFQVGKRVGTQMSHVGLHWAGGDQGTGPSISLNPCCSPAPQARKGERSFACCRSLLSVENAGASPRRTFQPSTAGSPQQWGSALLGAVQAGDPHWLSPRAAWPQLMPGQTFPA